MEADPQKLLWHAARINELETQDQRLRAAADALWECLGDPEPAPHRKRVSWIGFYTIAPDLDLPAELKAKADAAPGAMLLGPCRDKPACSPIGLHGACGQSFVREATLIVNDVRNLGEGYVACDPLDASELVIPLFDPTDRSQPRPWGVLDADSFALDAFTAADADLLERFCHEGGLTSRSGDIHREVF